MRSGVLINAGPLVAYLKRQDQFHRWVKAELANVQQPMFTCEAVIVEACFLLRNTYEGKETVLNLLSTGKIQIAFSLSQEAKLIRQLLKQYQSVPMSLADACLVRMSEIYSESDLLTLDSDFLIYRKNKNQAIALIMPNQ